MGAKNTKRVTLISYFGRVENLLHILTIGVALMATYFEFAKREFDVTQVIIAMLAILAFAQLAAGYSSILRDTQLDRLSQYLTGSPSATRFFHTRGKGAQWEDYFTDTRQLDALGLSLAGLCVPHLGRIIDMRNSGGRIRLLVANPENRFLSDAIAERSFEISNASMQSTNVRNVLAQLQPHVGASQSGGSLEVRVYDSLPSFAYVGTDTAESKGSIHIEMYLTQSQLNENPIFTLDSATDQPWYERFRSQFEICWERASDPY